MPMLRLVMLELLSMFRGKAVGIAEAGERYRKGIAKSLGIPEEWVSEAPARHWVKGFVSAFVKPEYREEALRRMGER